MITFAEKPIPIIIKENAKEGYLIYVESSGTLENDIWTVCLCDGGEILHCLTSQLMIHKNFTFGIHETDKGRNKK